MGFINEMGHAVRNGVKYLPLLRNLISRNLKKKYRSSVLGYMWCVLSPLLVMLIMNFVFSEMFKRSIPNYPVYLVSGRIMFFFITGSTQSMSRSIVGNGTLMRKTRVPYHMFSLASLGTAAVDFLFSLIAFVIVLVFTKTPVSIHVVAFPLVVLLMFLFCYGLGMLLAVANTFIKDVGQIYGVFTTAWMYLTPIFYTVDSLPERARSLITQFNPAYAFVQMTRSIFLDHQWPFNELMVMSLCWTGLFLILGLVAYARGRDQLILYV